MTKPILGIDLGTTYSSIGHLVNATAQVLTFPNNSKYQASIVCYTENGAQVGAISINTLASYIDFTIYDSKRMLGRRYTDDEIQALKRTVGFEIVGDQTDQVLIQLPANQYSPPKQIHPYEVSAEILKYLVEEANKTLNPKSYDCVITVPANWGERQREETQLAAKAAGLHVLQLLNEPTAAAYAYKEEMLAGVHDHKETNIVFDFGGGTLDISLFEMEGDKIDIKAVSGNQALGGRDFDQLLLDWVIQKCKFNKELLRPKDLEQIRKKCCEAKQILSTQMKDEIVLEYIQNKEEILIPITRMDFESICKPLFDQILIPVKDVLRQRKLDKSQIDKVLLVGGSSFIPKVTSILTDFFKIPDKIIRFNDPQLAVVHGAIYIAGKQSSPQYQNIQITEACPHTIGVKILGDVICPLFHQGDSIPATQTLDLRTAIYNQGSAQIDIYEGEYKMAKYNRLVTTLIINDLPPHDPGLQIKLSGTINHNSSIEATATCEEAGKVVTKTVNKNANLHSLDELRSLSSSTSVTPEEDTEEARISVGLAELTTLYQRLQGFLDTKKQSKLGSLKNELNQLIQSTRQRKSYENGEIKKAHTTWKAKLSSAGIVKFPNHLFQT